MNRIFSAAAFCGLVLFSGSASAALLDFTTGAAPANPVPVGDGISATFGTLGYTLIANPNNLTRSEAALGDCGGILNCTIDGYGIGDDEITGGTQSLTIEFDRSVWINQIYFLDLFAKDQTALNASNGSANADGNNIETATIDLFSATDTLIASFLFDAVVTKQVNGGFAVFDLPGVDNAIQAAKLVFTGRSKFGDDGSNDYALAGLSVNDVDINEVPLPASLTLLLTALAGFGVLSRRRKAFIA